MNIIVNKIRYFASLLLMLGLVIPWSAHSQGTAIISGDITACVGDVKAYTPDISNAAYSYHWSVTPVGMGTVLTGNHTGATVQWLIPGAANVELQIKDASNIIIYSGTLPVNVAGMPAPFITTNVELGCQPLNQDSIKGEQGSGPPPQFDSSHCQLVCENSTVEYYANGDAGSSFAWVVTGAVSYSPATGPICNVNWGATGFGEVRLIETSAYGCITETAFCVEIIEGPHAKFETVPPGLPDPIIVCRNGELVLQDMSTASASSPIISYLWDWGDGHTTPMSPGAASSPVSHVYDNPGSYVVTLTVINSCGCSSTYKRQVEVIDPEAPKIACPRVVCEKERAVYSVNPDFACDPDHWEVIGGTILSATPTTVEVVWDNVDPNTGFGYVMFHSCGPCKMTVVEPVPVVLQKAIIQGPPVICPDKQYVYRLPKWPSTEFNWFVSGPGIIEPTDQRNEIVVTATGSGVITLNVRYRNTVLGCGGNAEMHIKVLAPEAIVGPEALCQNATGYFNTGGGNVGNWLLQTATGGFVASGSGAAFSHLFTTPGNYRLSISGSTFCPPEDHLIKVVATPPSPDVITGPDRACPNIPMRYDAGNPVPGTTFKWFVTGGTVNAPVGDYSYITFGPLPAVVKAVRVTTDGLDCVSDTLYYNVDVAVPPLVISGPDSVCHSSTDNFSLNYTDGDNYSWEIAPAAYGSVSANGTTPNPTIQWNIPAPPGDYAWLIAKVMKCGTERRDSIQVYIKGLPVITAVSATPNPVCSDQTVTLSVTTAIPLTSGTFSVNWGDGYTTASLTHIYSTTGMTTPVVYTPTVTLTNANGCIGSTSFTMDTSITVMPKPAAVLSPSGPIGFCGSYNDSLHVTVTTGIGGSNSYTLFPGGITVGPDFAVSGISAGSYHVVVSNSAAGCASATNMVTFYDNCTPGTPGNPGTGCGPAPSITLSYSNDCGLLTLTPSLSGGGWSTTSPHITGLSTGMGGIGTATALAAGEYTFIYNYTYSSGCTKSYYINVVVPFLPELRHEISCNQPGGNYNITLYDHSTEYPGGAISTRNYYRTLSTWLGNGMSTTVTQAAGTTEVYYQVIGNGVDSCYAYDTVTTPAFPTVNVWMDPMLNPYQPGCVDDVTFYLSHSETGIITSHLWDFDDGSSNVSDTITIAKVYNIPSSPYYYPTLTVTDAYGCYATANTSIEVKLNTYKANLNLINNPACQGDPVTLQYVPVSSPYPGTYTWYHESSPLFTGAATTHNVFQPGGYWVLGTSPEGCLAKSDLKAVDIIQVPPVSIMGNAGACVNQTFTLSTQAYGAGYTYAWSGAASGTGTSLSQTLSTPGSYTYYVTVTHTASGCSQISPAFTVTISPPPPPPSLYFNITNCDPYQVELNASGVPGIYNWSNGMTGTPVYTPFGGDYQVTLTDLNGCVVQNSISVPKSLEEYIWVFPTGCFCVKNEAYVIGPIIPLNTWGWMKDGGFDAMGWGYMPPYWLTPGHTYNMYLDNGWCQLTSGDMYYMTDTCDKLKEAGALRPGGDGSGKPSYQKEPLGIDRNLLELSPNPAADYAMAHFIVASGSKARSIAVIDITGRVLQQHALQADAGSIRLALDGYAAGMYQIVLRRDGVPVQTLKLSVTK